MAASNSNPTVRRIELAARLRALRVAAGKSVEDAAAELMCSPAKISRMETGGRGVQPRDIRDLSRLYGMSKQVEAELQRAAADAKKRGWWQDYRSMDDQVDTFVALEAAAANIWMYENLRFPGLLQTEKITRGILARLRPPGTLSDDFIDDTVKTRALRRQRVVSGELMGDFILDEAMFRRPVDSAAVMTEQIDGLLNDARLPNVSIRIVPFDKGIYPGVDGAFHVLGFPADRNLSDHTYVEGLLGNFNIDDETKVAIYHAAFDDIGQRYALTEPQTVTWLRQLGATEHVRVAI